MAHKLEEAHARHTHHDEESLKHWRAWGSWFSWGSPVGLGLFFVLVAIAFAVVMHAVK